ncbi:hypothetical protein RhiirB3_441899 [Rhizophagus irregularis]|nr:hypothetical protein RhiirB3_441899 [Rhizophagus irregularis]
MEKIDSIIWKRRNIFVKDWERSLSIIKNKKRFYSRHRKKIPSGCSTEQNLDPPPRRIYTHRRVASTPYFREGGFYDSQAHIRWTSCNFLHSGNGPVIVTIFGLII